MAKLGKTWNILDNSFKVKENANLYISKAAHEKEKILKFGGPVSTQTTNIMQNHIKENHQGHIKDGSHVKNLA